MVGIYQRKRGKEVRATCIVYESLERAFQRIRAREYPPDFPSDIKDRKKRQALKLAACFSDYNRQIAGWPLVKVSRDFDVIQPVSGPLPDCFLSTLQNFLYSAVTCLSHSKTCSSEGTVIELRRVVKAQSARFLVLCSAN